MRSKMSGMHGRTLWLRAVPVLAAAVALGGSVASVTLLQTGSSHRSRAAAPALGGPVGTQAGTSLSALSTPGATTPAAPATRMTSRARAAGLAVSPATDCTAGTVCVSVDAGHALGPAQLVAQGFVHGVTAGSDAGLLSALHPRSWMYSGTEAAYGAARANGATVTNLLSDAWNDATYSTSRGSGIPPWSDWNAYSHWVQSYVQSTLAAHTVDYWEVQNEPDTPIGGVQPTVDQVLLQFAVAARAIRSVDPSARIVGPSISAYNDRPGNTLDLTTFLDYVVAQHIRLDAVSWHEVGARVSAADNPPDPESVAIDVARARRLVAARPQLGNPGIVINEYASVGTHLIPGWAVGWIGALEQAGVSAADRSCWHSRDAAAPRSNECGDGSLDGLLVGGSGLPQAVYWVHRAYAGMTGNRIATDSTDATVSSFATRDDATSTVRILVGRHQSCTAAVHADCPEPPSATPGPSTVVLHVRVPWATVRVTVQRIPNQSGAMSNPPPASEQVVAGVGPVVVPLPRFDDGDAYSVTLSAA